MKSRGLQYFAATLLACGCASTLPEGDPVTRALVRDVIRVVDVRAQTGWHIDDLELEAVLPDFLPSVCRVAPAKRRDAMRWIEERVQQEGGEPRALWLKRGKRLDAIRDLLLWTRARALLQAGDAWVNEGRCPFWLESDGEFSGLQGIEGRFLVAAEGGGRLYTQWEDGQGGIGGGGTMRLMSGYGFSERLTLLAGLEFGGAGRFTDLQFGEQVELPDVLLVAVVPVQARWHTLSRHVDFEAGPMAYINQARGNAQYGVRLGFGFGLTRLRVRQVLPNLTFALHYDYVPGSGELPTVHQFGAGMRGSIYLPF